MWDDAEDLRAVLNQKIEKLESAERGQWLTRGLGYQGDPPLPDADRPDDRRRGKPVIPPWVRRLGAPLTIWRDLSGMAADEHVPRLRLEIAEIRARIRQLEDGQ